MRISFELPHAFFAANRLNNTLIANDSNVRAHLIDNRVVQLDNLIAENDRAAVDKVLQAYEGDYIFI